MIPLDSMDLQLALQGKHSFGTYAVIECAHSVSDIFTSYRVSTSYGGDILPNAQCRVFSEMHTWHSPEHDATERDAPVRQDAGYVNDVFPGRDAHNVLSAH